MIKIGIVGTGYVGLVTGVCLSDFGWQVICADTNENIVSRLKEGKPTIYEPGLEDLLERNVYYKRINFTTSVEDLVNECNVIFIAVGTPQDEDGSADLSSVYDVAKDIGKTMKEYKIIVDKSTVPVGTGQEVKSIIQDEIKKRGLSIDFDVVSNPEFLRQGSAIQDFTHADRVVIGAESEKAIDTMKEVYRVLYINETPFLIVNIETAELVKYASNAFLATKISFVNELSELCENVGANIQQVARGMGIALPILHEYGIYPAANLGINRNIAGVGKIPSNCTDKNEIYEKFKDGFKSFYSFIIDLGFTMTNCCYPMSVDEEENPDIGIVYGASGQDEVISFTLEEKVEIFRALMDTIPSYRSKIRIFTPRSSLYSLIKQYEDNSQEPMSCKGGIDFFFVDASSGDTFPCGFRGNENLGKFYNLDIDRIEILKNPVKQLILKDPIYKQIWKEDLKYYNICEYFDGRKPSKLAKISKEKDMEPISVI